MLDTVKQHPLSLLGEPEVPLDLSTEVLQQATQLAVSIYGQKSCHALSVPRAKVWKTRISKGCSAKQNCVQCQQMMLLATKISKQH